MRIIKATTSSTPASFHQKQQQPEMSASTSSHKLTCFQQVDVATLVRMMVTMAISHQRNQTWPLPLQCLPPAYLPLRCSLGECGYIHSGRQADTCPVECHMKKQCAHCITTPGCGWCALGQMNGQGLCMRGGLVGPTGGSCREGNIRSDTGHQLDQFGKEGGCRGRRQVFLRGQGSVTCA